MPSGASYLKLVQQYNIFFTTTFPCSSLVLFIVYVMCLRNSQIPGDKIHTCTSPSFSKQMYAQLSHKAAKLLKARKSYLLSKQLHVTQSQMNTQKPIQENNINSIFLVHPVQGATYQNGDLCDRLCYIRIILKQICFFVLNVSICNEKQRFQ